MTTRLKQAHETPLGEIYEHYRKWNGYALRKVLAQLEAEMAIIRAILSERAS